jgi:hypothetical protein
MYSNRLCQKRFENGGKKYVLSLRTLTKKYKDFTAVDNLCLKVRKALFVAFRTITALRENDHAIHAYNFDFAHIGMRDYRWP